MVAPPSEVSPPSTSAVGAALVRLRRVNAALARWEEYHAAAALPADLRPAVEPPLLAPLPPPGGADPIVEELQQALADVVGEIERVPERERAV